MSEIKCPLCHSSIIYLKRATELYYTITKISYIDKSMITDDFPTYDLSFTAVMCGECYNEWPSEESFIDSMIYAAKEHNNG